MDMQLDHTVGAVGQAKQAQKQEIETKIVHDKPVPVQ